MRRAYERLGTLLGVLFVALAVTQTATPAVVVVAGIAAVVLIAAVSALVVAGSREVTVGARAHAHREALSTVPSPAHPSTAGRPRTRAPSAVFAAA